MRHFLVSILFTLISLSGATAQQQSKSQILIADNWLLKHMSSFSRLRSGTSLTKFKSQLLTRFERMDIDGDGISQADPLNYKNRSSKQICAPIISGTGPKMIWMAMRLSHAEN